MSIRDLNKRVTECALCPRLVAHRLTSADNPPRRFAGQRYWARPVPSFGPASARLLIVGLAPAAHGANRTGRMFTGDRSGDWLYAALHKFGFANQPQSSNRRDGLKLIDCYITAAARCAPPANKPTTKEFDTCRSYLRDELILLRRVRAVVVLGRIAFDQYLKACAESGRALPFPKPRFAHGAVHALPWGVTLIASYHPSQQNTFTKKLTRTMFHAVFRRARTIVDG